MALLALFLADGSRVIVGIGGKVNGKGVLGVGPATLVSPRAVECWRAFWKGELATL